MKQWVMRHGALVGGVFLVACGPSTKDETTGEDLAALAESNVEQALRGTHRAGSFLADSATVADSLSSLGGGTEYCTYECDADGICEDVCTTVDDPVSVEELQQDREDLNDSIDELMKTLREKVFTPGNLESEDGSSATYRIGPKTLCSTSVTSVEPVPGSGGTGAEPAPPAPELDPDCVDEINRLQPRLRLSSPSSGNVDVALLLTSERHEPVTLELYSDHVGIVVDLDETKGTLDALGEDTSSLTELVGKLGLELRKNADLDYSLRASVLDAVSLGIQDDAGQQIHYGISASVPTFELRLDGNARQVTGSLDYGTMTISGPLNAFSDSFAPEEYDPLTGLPVPRPTYTGNLEYLLAGLEGSMTFDGSTDKLTLSHLGLGDASSTLKLDGTTLAQVDVNANAGRHFDLTLEKQTDGTSVSFSPSIDVSALLNFAPLAAQIPDLAPDVLNNTLHFWFDGDHPTVQGNSDLLKVVSGTMHYESSYDPSQNFTAAAGSCIQSSSVDASTTDGVSGVAVTACQ
jgi:hypothetical protein